MYTDKPVFKTNTFLDKVETVLWNLKDFSYKLILTIILAAFCLIPTEIWFTVKHYVQPVGFWQNFALVGGGFWIGGTVQAILIYIFFFGCNAIWGLNTRPRRIGRW